MKKKFKFVNLALLLVTGLFFIPVSASAATISIQGWDLVDSGGRMDYDGNSKYMPYVQGGSTKWNGYKSGVIRPDSATVIEDVYCSDYREVSSTEAYTASNGVLKFNTYNMDSNGPDQKLNVATHELGHTLGLDHNTSTDIMYKYMTSITNLSANDKASYDAAAKLY